MSKPIPQHCAVSRIKIYVGIPTQEQRTIQGGLADLLEIVFKIPHLRFIDTSQLGDVEEGSAANQLRFHPTRDPFERIIGGATVYTSVFGHWIGGRPGARRVDDHSEVIEFIVDSEKLGATIMLLSTEFILPALCRAGEDSVLLVVDRPDETGSDHAHVLERLEIRRWKRLKPLKGRSTDTSTDESVVASADILRFGQELVLRTWAKVPGDYEIWAKPYARSWESWQSDLQKDNDSTPWYQGTPLDPYAIFPSPDSSESLFGLNLPVVSVRLLVNVAFLSLIHI